MDESSDQILVERVLTGDRTAYEILITRYYRRIYGVCLGIIIDPHESLDLCQETMLQGYVNIRSLRKADRFGVWMTKIAKNLCFERLRKQKQNRDFIAHLTNRLEHQKQNNELSHHLQGHHKLPHQYQHKVKYQNHSL